MDRYELIQNAKPILFNTEMVRAILDGRKTATRRCVKPKSKNACGFYVTFRESDNAFMGVYDYDENESMFENSQTPPCQPGDILYVRETFKRNMDGYSGIDFGGFIYKADCRSNFKDNYNPWRPSIHMPKEVARIFLKVTNVQVERLQDITEEQALSEGVPDSLDYPISKVYCPRCHGNGLIGALGANLGYMEVDCQDCDTAIKRFKNLWDFTIKKSDLDRYGWDANPWVWVIEFERISI